MTYYVTSKANWYAFSQAERDAGAPNTNFVENRRGRQIEKDERFWVVAALMAVFEDNARRIDELSALLTKCLGTQPPFPGFSAWGDALGSDPKLYFEANLASPPDYRRDLQQHLEEHLLEIPYIQQAAKSRGTRLEGPTKIDALLIAPDTGFNVLFEAKVMSDTSCQIEFDARRNQIARIIDVMLEPPSKRVLAPMNARDPAKSCFALITPSLFKKYPESRFYGWLMGEYQNNTDLSRHLAHRSPEELEGVPSRLGWLTWEEFNGVHPRACRWLP